jgi:hypothetical protein
VAANVPMRDRWIDLISVTPSHSGRHSIELELILIRDRTMAEL